MKGWKEGDRELRKVSACCVRGNQGVEHKAMQPSDPSTLRHEGTIMLREWVQTVPGMQNKEIDRSSHPP